MHKQVLLLGRVFNLFQDWWQELFYIAHCNIAQCKGSGRFLIFRTIHRTEDHALQRFVLTEITPPADFSQAKQGLYLALEERKVSNQVRGGEACRALYRFFFRLFNFIDETLNRFLPLIFLGINTQCRNTLCDWGLALFQQCLGVCDIQQRFQ